MNELPGVPRSRFSRALKNYGFTGVCIFSASMSIIVLAVLLISIAARGLEHFDLSFLTNAPSRDPKEAGLGPAIWGSIWICLVCGLTALPIGVGTAILLEEYQPTNRWVRKLHAFLQLNISNLAGVPSIVYGIIGLTVFVSMFNVAPINDPAFAIGQQWYDAYVDESGRALRVFVDDNDAPLTSASETLTYRDEHGDIVEVDLRTEEKVKPTRAAMETSIEAFKEVIDDHLERGETFTREQVDAAVTEAFAAAELQTTRDAPEPELTEAFFRMSGIERGIDFRQARRVAMEIIWERESGARLRNVLVADSTPARLDEKSWYYFRVPFGRGVLAGGLTLMLVILPIVIISSQEALRAVPKSLREGALAAGATRWQMVRQMTLPAAVPGIMTGAILAMSRAIGEAAPILVIAGIVFIRFTPQHLMDDFTAMPLQIFNWASLPQEEFYNLAATGIIVLLGILLTFNATAVFIRYKFQKPLQ